MKTIGRILIILLAAGVVVGGAWALTRNGANTQFAPGEAGFRQNGNFDGQGFAPGQHPEGFREGGFGRDRRDGRFLPLGWIRNIGLIAVVVAVTVFAERVMDKMRIKRATKIPEDDAQTA